MSKVYIGVDHGSKGALAAISETGKILAVLPIPLKEDGEIDCFQIYSWLFENWGDYEDEVVACGERLHAIFRAAASSTFSFGKNVGKITGIIECLEMDYYEVRAVDWQKLMFSKFSVPECSFPLKAKQKKPKRDTKLMALKCAARAWPLDEVIAYVDHDGIIDALLIAEYSRLTYQKNKNQLKEVSNE